MIQQLIKVVANIQARNFPTIALVLGGGGLMLGLPNAGWILALGAVFQAGYLGLRFL